MAQITGNAAKVWLGMSLRPVTRDVALAFHLPQPSGLLVTRVDVWSPAGTSGLESGDILLALDAQRIADIQDLELKIREMTQRKTVTMAVFRDGAIHQIEVNVGEIPGRVAQSAAVVAQP
jgi:serine protease Do